MDKSKKKVREGRLATKLGTIWYWVDDSAGVGAPWLAFLPGLTADHRLFDNQMAYFSGKANCLVWDPPAHGASRPFALEFTLDEMARMLHDLLLAEGVKRPVLVGQSMGGYVSQAYLDLFPHEACGFVSIDSAPLKRRYYPTWEVKALQHTKGMYEVIPFWLLKPWGAHGVSTTKHGRELMRAFMDDYDKTSYVELAAFGYRILADAIEADRSYDIGCPALLLCGEHDRAGDVKPFNRKWSEGDSIPLVWVPGAGHNANVDNPVFVNERIEELLTQI
ncbi:MAG: alpha/beta hydrolase [Coriobacteriales bacterium]|nr:alpha/beta hydrolase [Coriobacteriales bacterium]